MPGLQEFLANLSGSVGGGVTPDQARSSLALALLTGGLSTIGNAGTQGFGAIAPGLQDGLATFGASVGAQRDTASQDRAFGMEERRLGLAEERGAREAEVFEGQNESIRQQQFFFDRLRSNPGEIDQIEAELEENFGDDTAMRIYIQQSRDALDLGDFGSFQDATTNLAKRAEEVRDGLTEVPEPEDIIFVEKFGVRTPMLAQRDEAGNVTGLSEIPNAPAGVGQPEVPTEAESFPEPPSVSTFLTGARQDARFQRPVLTPEIDEDGLPVVLPDGSPKMVADFEGKTTFDMDAALKSYYQDLLPQFEQNDPSPDGSVTKEQTIQAVRQANPDIPMELIEQQVNQFFGSQTAKTQTDLANWFQGVDWDGLATAPQGGGLDGLGQRAESDRFF